MATVPPGQPRVPVTGDGAGEGPPRGRRGLKPTGRRRRRALRWLAIAAPALIAINIAKYSDVVGIDAVDDVARVVFACTVVFGVAGFGVTRLCLPDGLRRHELLWILPVGAVTVAFAMTPIGFAAVPFALNLALVMGGGLALSVVAWRRRGLPARPELPAVGWPVYVGLLLLCVALVPMFRSGFATVIGQGSDAHMAAGTAEFLRHNPPLGVDASLPVDEVWLVWRSKQAIYYAFAAVTTFSGMETYEVLSTLAALLLSLAAVGWYVMAREMLGAAVWVAVVAMAIAGLDRMVLHTGIHPYFNQTWGYFTVPFAIVLSWWVVRHPSRGGIALLGLFLAVGAFAYPLAVPIPLLVLVVMWWMDRRERRHRGERLFGWRDLWARFRALRGRSQLVGWAVVALLAVPLYGVWEKVTGASQILINPNYSLILWGGDLKTWFPEPQFFAIHMEEGWWLALVVIVAFCLLELRRLPRPAAAGLLAVILIGAAVAAEMRARDYGWYFHFKMLAFVGPLVIVIAAVGIARVRRWRLGVLLLALWTMWAAAEAREEVSTTFDELPRTMLDLRGLSDSLPAGSSVRLDMQPAAQLWVAYLLHEHRLCSQRPIDNTAYPHVPVSRAADYVLVRYLLKPFDAVGDPVFDNREFRLYRLAPGLPGGDRCSQRMIQTVTEIQRG